MKLRLIAGLAGLLIWILGAASAQVKTDPGVARISLIHGEVSTQRGDSGDWGAAALNAPVVSGDRISTGDKSRAEVQLDHANILRFDERTQANLTALTRTEIQIQLGHGLANYSVFKNSEADAEIDTPNLSVHAGRRDASMRITVISDEQTEVLVRKGEVDVSTPQGSTHLKNGQLITVRGTGNDTQYKIADAPSRDDFDRWTNDRDNTIRNAQAWSRTNRYYVGSEDLDAYGRWETVPDYGQVWVPVVDSGWAPYRAGQWVWEPYWGWTWVSYEPWGWAPYHYGRWFYYGSSWVWWPGQSYGYRHYRPIWAPAYVSFFGFGGGGFGFGFGGGWGSIGWLPIGPCDGFYPWWGGYRSRFNVVNVTNITNIYNIHNHGIPPLRGGTKYSNVRLAMENEHIRQAVSTVGSSNFGRGRVAVRPASEELFRNGKMVAGNLPVVPTRESLLAGERRAAPTVGQGTQQRFFGNNRSAATPQSFDREAAEVRTAIQHDGRFTAVAGNQRSTAGETNPRAVGRSAGEAPGVMKREEPANTRQVGQGPGTMQRGEPAGNGGGNQAWRRFGQPERQATSPAASNSSPSKQPSGQNSEWRRFPSSGTPQSGSVPSNNGNRVGNGNTPDARRAPNTGDNQQWRRINRPSEEASRGTSGPAAAPASRDRGQRENSTPTQSGGNDWRRITPTPERNDSELHFPYRNSAPEAQRDSGNWRQSAPRDSGREYSRPSLDMRQPIVTPRSSGGPSGGYYGGGGGRSAPSPSHGGSGGGGGRSAPSPSHGGGGQPHSSGGGNSGPHRGR